MSASKTNELTAENKMTATKLKSMAVDLLLDMVGSFLIAVGIYNFAAASDFPFSGISGIALIFCHFFKIPIGVMTVLLNVPIILMCARRLGRSFFLRSLRTMAVSAFFMDVVAPLLPVYEGNLMLSGICLGVISGLGYALIYMRDTSTGGMDFVIMAIRSIKPHLSLGRIIIVLDCSVVLLGGILMNGDVDRIIYGLIASYILSVVVDAVIHSLDVRKVALIVTEHGQQVSDKIDDYTQRGTTLLKGQGGYTGSDKQVVMCACSNNQIHRVQEAVKEVDREAFLIIMEANQVRGNGFRLC